MTPQDDYAYVGDPPMFLPEASEVHISCTFTWDTVEAERLAGAWGQYYSDVKKGGFALNSPAGEFIPGMYLRWGVTITSRGCNNQCPWCLVSGREGRIRELKVCAGNVVQDNNLLHCSRRHIREVFEMLKHQHGVTFQGGLDTTRLTPSIIEDLKTLRIHQIFVACDTKGALKSLEQAGRKLEGVGRDKLRCFVLVGYDNETIDEALGRLVDVWNLGFMPFAQLYQPDDNYIRYPWEWRKLANIWSRPARMKAFMYQHCDPTVSDLVKPQIPLIAPSGSADSPLAPVGKGEV